MDDGSRGPRALAGSLQRRRVGAIAVCAVLLSVLGLALVNAPEEIAERLDAGSLLHALGNVAASWRSLLLDWRYWGFLALLGGLERAFPARRGEGLFSVGAAQDLVWLLVGPLFIHTVVHGYDVLLEAAAPPWLDSPSLDLRPQLGTAGLAVLAFVLGDGVAWGSHLLRHRVAALWHFHEVHHSQTAMSPLLDKRVHPVEWMVTATIFFLPARILGLPAETIALVATASLLYSTFLHANIRTNLGPLRYVLVTPQSHRIHHSPSPAHVDTNFGTTLCVWDRLFGLQCPEDTVYPPVGVADRSFPLECSARPAALLATCARQLLHPFAALLGDVARGRPE